MEEEAAAKGKERRVTFRMEGDDYDALCERCERAGLSKSEYLRYLVRIPLSTEANAGDEHRILVDRRALWVMSRELTKWGYHYNQAVHAMNLINFHARHGHVDRDLVAESIPTIERETDAAAEPVAFRKRGWKFLLAEAREVEEIESFSVSGTVFLQQVLGELVCMEILNDNAAIWLGNPHGYSISQRIVELFDAMKSWMSIGGRRL